jgi:hypothetical protein
MSDDYVKNARFFLQDEDLIKKLFIAIRQYYTGIIDLSPLLNILEAMTLNAITERKHFVELSF